MGTACLTPFPVLFRVATPGIAPSLSTDNSFSTRCRAGGRESIFKFWFKKPPTVAGVDVLPQGLGQPAAGQRFDINAS